MKTLTERLLAFDGAPPVKQHTGPRQGQAALPDDEPQPNAEGSLNSGEAFQCVVNTVLGVGVLSAPYAFRLCGYGAMALLVVIIWATAQTGKYIGHALWLAERSPKAAGVPRSGRDLAFLGDVCFGRAGRVAVGAVTAMELWFALVTYTALGGVNASLVLEPVTRAQAIGLCMASTAVLVFAPMRLYSYLSLAASVALCLALAAMLGATLSMPDWAHPPVRFSPWGLDSLWDIPRGVGILACCFGGHPCFPIVRESMRKPARWGPVIDAAFVVSAVVYGGLGLCGYASFGASLQASVTQNIARIEGADILRDTALLAFMVKIIFTTPLMLNALVVMLWAPSLDGPLWPCGRIALLFFLAAFTAAASVAFADKVQVAAALAGNLFVMATSIVIPTAVYLRLRAMYEPGTSSRGTQFKLVVVLVFGVAMGILGTVCSISDLLGGALS